MMKKKRRFWLAESFVLLAFAIWIFLTIAYFSRANIIPGFKVDLSVESVSNKKISSIPGLSTVTQLGWVLVFISTALMIIYIGIALWLYLTQINRTVIFWCNIAFLSLTIGVTTIGILFGCLQL